MYNFVLDGLVMTVAGLDTCFLWVGRVHGLGMHWSVLVVVMVL